MANTFTLYYSLPKPADGDRDWGIPYREAMDLVDTRMRIARAEIDMRNSRITLGLWDWTPLCSIVGGSGSVAWDATSKRVIVTGDCTVRIKIRFPVEAVQLSRRLYVSLYKDAGDGTASIGTMPLYNDLTLADVDALTPYNMYVNDVVIAAGASYTAPAHTYAGSQGAGGTDITKQDSGSRYFDFIVKVNSVATTPATAKTSIQFIQIMSARMWEDPYTGIVEMPFQSMAQAYKNATASISSNSASILSYEVESYDTQSEWSTNYFTPKTTGQYLVSGLVKCSTTPAASCSVAVDLWNSTDSVYHTRLGYRAAATAVIEQSVSFSTVATLIAGKAYAIVVIPNGATLQVDVNGLSGTYVVFHRIA